MYLTADLMADRAVNELMTLQWPQARKLRGHDQRLEMGIVCGQYLRLSARETGLDTGLNCCCVHNAAVYGKVCRLRVPVLNRR